MVASSNADKRNNLRNTKKLNSYLDVSDFRTVYWKVTIARQSNDSRDNRVDRDSSVGIANCYGLELRGANHLPHLARSLEKEWRSNSIPTLHRQCRL